MAILDCPKHGLTGPELVCPHAANQFELGVRPATTEVEVDDLIIRVVNLCEECRLKWLEADSGSERDSILDTCSMVCAKCLEET